MTIDDEKWQQVMSQTQGYKVAAAIHDLMGAIRRKNSGSHFDLLSFNAMPIDYQEELQQLVAELFDNEVIEGGRRLPEIYTKVGHIGTEPEGSWLQLHPHNFEPGPKS